VRGNSRGRGIMHGEKEVEEGGPDGADEQLPVHVQLEPEGQQAVDDHHCGGQGHSARADVVWPCIAALSCAAEHRPICCLQHAERPDHDPPLCAATTDFTSA
jgi:hypothetical protein